MEAMTEHRPPHSDPRRLSPSWSHYWRLMRWMVLAAIVAVAAALYYLHVEGGLVSIHMVIATIAGVGASVLLGAGLMLLVFMSSGSGHDEDVGGRKDRP
ncbi:hypothetical protein CV103_15730 [Sphingomonas fennica]|uniref:Uncharacterized protein n=2 Tax=Alphaproteobacteria TaxID=28211 RepID=A0A2T4HQF0_9SPHN|nr:hypothetical protein G432_08675 [Sphingomonas sp. MM-1]PTD18040.1 hypothetical protein CV103_15730 [Sphingomonas fennica]